MISPELILQALKNTSSVEGAKRAVLQVESVYLEIENSFFGPQIYAELQRLHKVIKGA